MTLTIKRDVAWVSIDQWRDGLESDDHQRLRPGETVDYVAHVVGGMVKVEQNGAQMIIDPRATEELDT